MVSIFEAQDLPIMDRYTRGGIGGKGIDAFIQVNFGGNPNLRTKVVHVKAGGKDNEGGGLNAEFMEQLWIPINVPTMCNRVALSVWDRDIFTANKCVAHHHFSFKHLPKISSLNDQNNGFLSNMFKANKFQGPPPTWINLYGAATDIKKRKVTKFENTYPELASTYRGRLLLSLHVCTEPPKNVVLLKCTIYLNTMPLVFQSMCFWFYITVIVD